MQLSFEFLFVKKGRIVKIAGFKKDICVEDCEVEDVKVTKSENLAPRVDGYGASIISD